MIEYIAAIDTQVLQFFFEVRDPATVQALIWVSEFGRAWTVYGLGAALLLLLVARGYLAYATGLFISLTATGLSVLFLKGIVARPRPSEEFQAYLEVWHSFPSAHAALAAALYLFLLYIAWKSIPAPLWRYVAVSALAILILLVSFSRVYLGVHYASDVAAGILLGALSAWIGIRYVRFARTS